MAGKNGYRRHVSVAAGKLQDPVYEGLAGYLDFDVARPQEGSLC